MKVLTIIKKIVFTLIGILLLFELLGIKTDVFALVYESGSFKYPYNMKIPSLQYSNYNYYLYEEQFDLDRKVDYIREWLYNEEFTYVNAPGLTVLCNINYKSPGYVLLDNIDSHTTNSGCSFLFYDMGSTSTNASIDLNIYEVYIGSGSKATGNSSSDYIQLYNYFSGSFSRVHYNNITSYVGNTGSTYYDFLSIPYEEFVVYFDNTIKPKIINDFNTTDSSGATFSPYFTVYNTSIAYFENGQVAIDLNNYKYNFDILYYYSDWEITTTKYPTSRTPDVGPDLINNFYINNSPIDTTIPRIMTFWDYKEDGNIVNSNQNGLVDGTQPGGSDVNDTLTDSTPPNNEELGDFVDGIVGYLPQGPLDAIINLPLNVFNNFYENLSQGCSPVVLRLPYVDTDLTLSCPGEIIRKIDTGDVFMTWLGLIGSVVLGYTYLLNLYKWTDSVLWLEKVKMPGYYNEP